MKEQRIKSIYYKLISMGCDIYIGENNNEFFAVKHGCVECKSPWYMNLTECFFCGMTNSYLYHCANCDTYSSTTGGPATCRTCREKRKKICFNDNCITNKSKFVEEFNRLKNGVMDKNSPSTTSQSHCIECGCSNNLYYTSFICLREVKENEKINVLNNDFKKYDVLIFVKTNTKKYLIINKKFNKNENNNFKNEIEISKIFF